MMRGSGTVVPPQFDSAVEQRHAATLGMWIFLATEVMFFGPLFLGFLYGRMHWPQGFAVASRHTDVLLGTLNTALLLTSSLFMVLAVEARRLELVRHARRLLSLTALLGLAFLVIKGVEYRKEFAEHLFPGSRFGYAGEQADAVQYFFFLYFAATGLHALHLAIGIAMTAFLAFSLQQRPAGFANAERIELVGLYWHFVDCVWIVLYPVLYLVGRAGG